MAYYVLADIKTKIGESGFTNDAKITEFGEDADSFINSLLINVKDLTVPIAAPSTTLIKLSNNLAVAYFFSGESGDKDLAESAEERVRLWFNSSYNRPRFKARSG